MNTRFVLRFPTAKQIHLKRFKKSSLSGYDHKTLDPLGPGWSQIQCVFTSSLKQCKVDQKSALYKGVISDQRWSSSDVKGTTFEIDFFLDCPNVPNIPVQIDGGPPILCKF